LATTLQTIVVTLSIGCLEGNMVRLSRVELHDLVWSKPMTEIARQFGVRDQHIARACDDADIARPRAGHWQNIEHGKSVPRVALGNDRFAADDIIAIDASGWSILQAE
jgi:hypothetical protein